MPNDLYQKLKIKSAERKTSMRDLITHAVEVSLQEPESSPFRLRDAAVGEIPDGSKRSVSAEEVNRVIDGMRERTVI